MLRPSKETPFRQKAVKRTSADVLTQSSIKYMAVSLNEKPLQFPLVTGDSFWHRLVQWKLYIVRQSCCDNATSRHHVIGIVRILFKILLDSITKCKFVPSMQREICQNRSQNGSVVTLKYSPRFGLSMEYFFSAAGYILTQYTKSQSQSCLILCILL